MCADSQSGRWLTLVRVTPLPSPRWPVLLLLLLGFVFLGFQPASAAIAVEFTPPAAPPGAAVTIETRDASMVQIPSGRLALFLAPSPEAAENASGPEDPNLVAIGELVSDSECFGRHRFFVPPVPPGKYALVAHCRECTPEMTFPSECDRREGVALPPVQESTDGTLFVLGGEGFEVIRASTSAETGPVGPLWLWVGGGAILVALVLVLVRRRRSPS